MFDSSICSRKKIVRHEIKILSKMLLSYLLDNGFFEVIERTNFGDCHAYKENITGSLSEPEVPFWLNMHKILYRRIAIACQYYNFF